MITQVAGPPSYTSQVAAQGGDGRLPASPEGQFRTFPPVEGLAPSPPGGKSAAYVLSLSTTAVAASEDETLKAGEDARLQAQQQAEQKAQAKAQQQEQSAIAQLASRDAEVRMHERAHSAVGGQLAGAPSYRLVRGPDGKSYATAGEVSIDISTEPNDPEATLAKAERVMRAALAPADPSPQDLAVAAAAAQLMAEARAEIAVRKAQPAEGEDEGQEKDEPSVASVNAKAEAEQAREEEERQTREAEEAAQLARFEEARRSAAELGRRLLEIGALGHQLRNGGLVDASA